MAAGDGAAAGGDVEDQRKAAEEYEDFHKSLRGLKKISLVTDAMTVCNWSLGFCALTWASAVLLGAYITELRIWDYYDVSVLLFVEGLRFGVAALMRMLGIYRITSFARFLLRCAQLFIPLWMGGFALLSILPMDVRDGIEDRFFVGRIEPPPPATSAATSHVTAGAAHRAPHLPYNSLSASLTIFYGLILANAIVLLLGNTITGSMRLIYVRRSRARSLYLYHDKLLTDSSSWMQAGVDLDFAFLMQSFEYKREKPAKKICQDYVDVVGYLYMHEKGVEAAEVALEADDVYVKEAAAHMVGFWAWWEKCRGYTGRLVPLRYQGQLLSLLVDLAEERYGATSSAAAGSLGLLMEAGSKEGVEKMLKVLKRKEKKLMRMLVQRAMDVMEAASGVAGEHVRRNSTCHMYALKQVVKPAEWRNAAEVEARLGELAKIEEEELFEKEKVKVRQLSAFLSNLDDGIAEPPVRPADLQAIFKEEEAVPLWWRGLKTAGFVLLNVAIPLTLGFIVKALSSMYKKP